MTSTTLWLLLVIVPTSWTVDDGDLERSWPEARGIVVDESGEPIAGVALEARSFGDFRAEGNSAADGIFAIPIEHENLNGTIVLARSDDGRMLGFADCPDARDDVPDEPLEIVLRPARELSVRVVDAQGAPVAGAAVQTIGSYVPIAEARTDDAGQAAIRLPVDAPVESVIALGSGLGFDYLDHTNNRRPRPAAELPEEVTLTLGGARTVHVRAVGTDGGPLEGIELYPWLIQLPGRQESANLGGTRLVDKTTGADGVATFDWIPAGMERGMTFFNRASGYHAPERTDLEPDALSGTTLTTELYRRGSIRGRVTLPDGAPAEGIRLEARGTGGGFANSSRATAWTAPDGTFAMDVDPTQAFVVAVIDDRWGAPSHVGVIVHEGEEVDGVDFRLGPGAVIRGTVIVGEASEPVADQGIMLVQSGGKIPDELERGDGFWHEVRSTRWVNTDADGHFEIRVGPGTYKVQGPTRTESREVEAVDGSDYVVDFRMPRPAKGPLAGRVVRADDPSVGVAGVNVQGVSNDEASNPDFSATTDADGRFALERYLDRMLVHAETPDRTLGGIVALPAEAEAITIPIGPTATANGVALDESGAVMADRELDFGVRVYLGDPPDAAFSTRFGPRVTTDAQGRFNAPGMVPGTTYGLSYLDDEEGYYKTLIQITPEEPGPIDLGTLTMGEYREPSLLSAEEMSSFRADAPDAGDPAPALSATTLDGKPLSLEDFRGRYLLIDFWATWCGPCIAELPVMEAVHDRFGDNDRFAMLSLSVDQEIASPIAFQTDRRLPWTQGFVGEGVHGSAPDSFGVRAIPALVLVGPDGTIVARGMRGDAIAEAVADALDAEVPLTP